MKSSALLSRKVTYVWESPGYAGYAVGWAGEVVYEPID